MIRMIPSKSAAQAKKYFSDALLKSDYYTKDQELQGRIKGLLADRLGLGGPASKDVFFDLSENRNPATGKALTVRNRQERVVGYDINFHCPKSVSILHILSKDDHILDAFQLSVDETMRDIEADAKTRVRKGGTYDDRQTGELMYADFIHQTARPVEDHLPDPHLHAHCFVFNATWDDTEKCIKAGKFRDIKRDMPYYQARFQKRLADKMVALGYAVLPTGHSFEIKGVPEPIIAFFSKRTNAIGQLARKEGITDAKALDGLGARTRSKKQKGLSMYALKAEWRKNLWRLSDELGIDKNKAVRFAQDKQKDLATAKECVEHAISHSFERASVISERKLLESAYRFGIGHMESSLDEITAFLQQDKRLISISEGDRQLCTTREVLAEEKRMVELARQGRGAIRPLFNQPPELRLEGQQFAAVAHILTTSNRVSIIRGAAGTGKTTLLKEAARQIETVGKKVFVVAPTAEASRGVLRAEGFETAETVAFLLTSTKLQQEIEGQVLWLDEAGLMGTKDMAQVLDLVTKKNAQLILGGDTRQHASVVRGDALRILNTVGGIKSAEVSKIYRQKNIQYKSAVEDLSKGNIKGGFEKLEMMNAVITVDPMNPREGIVKDFLELVRKKKSALIVSPTHKEGEAVTKEIRRGLQEKGLIDKKEITVERLVNLNLTEAEKNDLRNFKDGQVLQFNQNMSNIKRGSRWAVKSDADAFIIENEKGKTLPLPADAGNCFDVLRVEPLTLAKGDKVRITRNGMDDKKRRLNNGMALEVSSITKGGKIHLFSKKGKYVLDKEFGHLSHDYCVTSHGSQGKTVDEVLIMQPSATFPATDAKQFYVSVSRGKEGVRIYTDDKETLLEHAANMRDRRSALELVGKSQVHINHILHNQRAGKTVSAKNDKPKANHLSNIIIDLEYE